ncbi:MAG: histidinol-phosphatase, partial [Saprospiraceae bacterium]|nr:histidinol-phosphatase [Saprospiraceae bacterium]
NYHRQGKQWSNAGRGWIMVYADSLQADHLIAALENGDFYASTGVELSAYQFSNNTITLDIKEKQGVNYTIEFIGCLEGESDSRILHSVNGSSAHFMVDENYLFVRVKIMSDQVHPNPIEDLNFEMAWTQPVQFVRN